MTKHTIIDEKAFERAWSEAKAQKGWFSRGEARALFALFDSLPKDSVIVEIGAYCGRASAVLARSGLTLHCVDPLIMGTAPTGTWQVTEEHEREFNRVLDAHSNINWHRVESLECRLPNEPIGLLVIDGDHDYPAPHDDFKKFEPALGENSLIAFHDYKVCSGVTKTVDMLIAENTITRVKLRERLFIARYNNK